MPVYWTSQKDKTKEVWVLVEAVDRDNPSMVIAYAIDEGDLKELTRMAMPPEGQTAFEEHHGNFTQDR